MKKNPWEDLDEPEDRQQGVSPPKRKRRTEDNSPWSNLLLIIMVTALVTVATVAVTLVSNNFKGITVMTVPQLRAAVMGKTPDQVMALIGRPDYHNEESKWSGMSWSYYDAFFDPISQKMKSVTVYFTSGANPKVDDVR